MTKHSHVRRARASVSVHSTQLYTFVVWILIIFATVAAAMPLDFRFSDLHKSPTSLIPSDPSPQALPYVQDFGSLAHASTAYPAGWQGWILGGGSTFSFRTVAPNDNVNLIANSTSATTASGVHNYNGKIGFLPTGSADPAVGLAIDTSGFVSVSVGFDIMTIRNQKDASNTRINQVDLQYRICPAPPSECTGPFTSVSGSANGIYENNTVNQTSPGTTNPQKLENKNLVLPSAADDQPNVQLRWVQRDASGGGSRPSFAIDNLLVTGAPQCTPPSIVLAPANQNVTYGVADVSFTASASGEPTPSVQWQVDTGAGFIDLANGGGVSGADSLTLTIAVPDVSMSGNSYRAVFSNGCDAAATTAPANLSVAPLEITVTPDPGQSKTYGDDDPPLTFGYAPQLLFSDVFSGELARDPGEAAATYNIEQGTLSLSANYDLVFTPVTFVITPKALTASVAAAEKVYDGTDAVSAECSLAGVIGADLVSCSIGTASFPNRNVGAYTVTADGLSLGGPDAGNYSLPITTATDGAEILVRAISVSAVGTSKMYDGTVASAGSPIVSQGSVAAGDTAAFTQAYADRHAGVNKTLTPSGIVDDGNGGNNYAVDFIANSDGVITPRPVTVTAVTATKAFDGNTASSGVPTISPPLISGDLPGFVQTYDTPSVGTGKTLTPSGLAIDGNSGLNYAYTFVPVNTGVISGAAFCFEGFASPIGGSVESGNGGTPGDPVRSFKLNSTIPIKFTLYAGGCGGSRVTTGVHTLQLFKYANAVDSDPAIDATPTDSATTGNQFRLVDSEWHYNLDTKKTPGISPGTWLVRATLSDGTIRTVWISIKR